MCDSAIAPWRKCASDLATAAPVALAVTTFTDAAAAAATAAADVTTAAAAVATDIATAALLLGA